ncbi:MAG: tRNA (adenosine(37)-N6)-threonylcarbamoyltransferase complex transferase subunit TsaD [Bacteriovoracaceae bacterium]|nr:tRNA (adenosine(37)-N6)-threonylcarbamoyltransferase complex transferase subunit TsaD [Bacteriovoracaceae bacterium]
MKEKVILGIETSCDDTSIALIKGNPENLTQTPVILAHQSFSQELILQRWGGVVPEIAARNHLEKITPLLAETFKIAGIKVKEIDLVAVTTHPGLLGPLLTGINCAKTLSLIHELPLSSVNHLYAHLEAIHLTSPVAYPYLGLLVSGGHSLYLKVTSPFDFEIIGNTIDDAAGEAFDKGGKLLGLGYPAGKIIDDLAKSGDLKKYTFPISMLDSGDATLSFSGVKTSLRNFIEKSDHTYKMEDVCASYQHAIIEALARKLKVAQNMSKMENFPIVVGGGVACNSYLRTTLLREFKNVHFVEPKYCTDNGAMIANYGLRTYQNFIPYPDCLALDARGQFVSKQDKLKKSREAKND